MQYLIFRDLFDLKTVLYINIETHVLIMLPWPGYVTIHVKISF